MNKKMFIICVVFVLISSCKHYGSGKEDLKNSGQSLREQVKGALDTTKDGLKEGVVGGLRNPGLGALGQEIQADEPNNPEVQADVAPQGQQAVGVQEGQQVADQQQAQVQVNVQLEDQPVVQAQELVEARVVPGAEENIKKEIEDLKNKINKADSKKTSLQKYREYEEEVKKLREKIKELKDKKTSEDELKKLEESLKTKKGARKKDLEDSKNKFEGFKKEFDDATGETEGAKAQKQGQIGAKALQEARQLGLRVNADQNSKDTSKLANQVINGAIKEIEEELAANNIQK
ncbi:hypothetical protein [Borreliella lusitaniae]|uniref:hypothetical protein n=1 Tax=Borreliella lusitaniae TaxID=100177 RepID=UPI003C74E672